MDEEAARRWLADDLGVSRETLDQLERFAAFLREEASAQNLIARSTLDSLWQRHIVDSAQLLKFASPTPDEHWLDLGTGAGFPGLVVAVLAPCRVTLVESRALRVDYLNRAVSLLGLGDRVRVAGCRLERLEGFAASFISARAFAPLPDLLDLAGRFSTENTLWLLPKGQSGRKELESLPVLWHDLFHVEESLTDPKAVILVGKGKITPAARPKAPRVKRRRQQR